MKKNDELLKDWIRFIILHQKSLLIFGMGALAGMGITLLGVMMFSHEPNIEGTPRNPVALKDSQKEPLLKIKADLKVVYRYQDPKTHDWKVEVGTEAKGAKNATALGQLFLKPQGQEVEQPVYLCQYKEGSTVSSSLDSNPGCTGEGTLLEPKPVGYVSKLIRSGFLLMVRCKSQKNGMYNSLNPRCDSPGDRFQTILGAIRTIYD